MSESLILEWELLNTCNNAGNKIVKEIPIYKSGVFKGKLCLDKKGNPFYFSEILGSTGYKVEGAFFDIWDENTGASAKKVRVVYNNNLKDLYLNNSKWGEEQLVKIVWAKSSFPGGRKYQRINLLPIPK